MNERFYNEKTPRFWGVFSLFGVDDDLGVGVVAHFLFNLADGADLQDGGRVDTEFVGESSVNDQQRFFRLVEVVFVFLVVVLEGEHSVAETGEGAERLPGGDKQVGFFHVFFGRDDIHVHDLFGHLHIVFRSFFAVDDVGDVGIL